MINYHTWKEGMERILRVTRGWNIIQQIEQELTVPPSGIAGHAQASRDLISWTERSDDAATAIYMSCSTGVRPFLKDISNPNEMWNKLTE